MQCHTSVSNIEESDTSRMEASYEGDRKKISSSSQSQSSTRTQTEIEPVPGYDPGVLKKIQGDLNQGEKLLDVWYAQFAEKPLEVRLLLQKPEHFRSLIESVSPDGVDSRVQITNTRDIPWRWICSLYIVDQDNMPWVGTGWLVGPRTVITAGHCVYIHKPKGTTGWARSIDVIPGRNGTVEPQPFGSARASSPGQLHTIDNWVTRQDRNYDYGAIILPRDQPFGMQNGYFGFASLADAELNGKTGNIAGYPLDKGYTTLWFDARGLGQLDRDVIYYTIDTNGGQSGAPVWIIKDGQTYAVGIHTNGWSGPGNSATRINRPVYDNIRLWKQEGS